MTAEDGARLRDEGLALAESSLDFWWTSCADRALRDLARSGRPFSVDDLRDAGVPDPRHSPAWGALFRSRALAGLIEPAGFTVSRTPSRRAAVVRLWIGTEHAA